MCLRELRVCNANGVMARNFSCMKVMILFLFSISCSNSNKGTHCVAQEILDSLHIRYIYNNIPFGIRNYVKATHSSPASLAKYVSEYRQQELFETYM